MALVEWLLPSMWVEPPTSSRWMAAQQLSIVLVKAQSGKYKHDDHNDQRKQFVICHYATSFVQYVRKGGEKPGAISQPCLAAKPPFLPGETPTVILTCARPHCQRRPPCGGRRFACRGRRKASQKRTKIGASGARIVREDAGNRRSGGNCRFAGNAARGVVRDKSRRASAKGTVSRGGRRFASLRPAAHGQQFRRAVFLVHVALVQHVQRSRQGGGP